MLTPIPRIALGILLCVSCGKRGRDPGAKRDAGSIAPVTAPIAMPVLGVDRIGRYNFIHDDGAPAYRKAAAAAEQRDWAAVRAQCEAALAKDPFHLDARRLLAIALAKTSEHAAAVDHLVAAIAADYYQYGAGLAGEADLKDFFATSHGQAVMSLAQQIRDEYARKIQTGLWVVGRRSTFRWPEKLGAQPGATRAELYAYDREAKRYFRLSHTQHQVAAFLRSPSGGEVALLGFDRIDRTKDDVAPPLIARAWIQAFEPSDWKETMPRITLSPARAVAVYYGAGDQLLAASAQATGRWTTGEWTAWSVDRAAGKLTQVPSAPAWPRTELTLDEGRVVRALAIAGVQAAWTGEPPALHAPVLETGGGGNYGAAAGGATIRVPESGQAAHETIAVAAGGAQVAFATAVDPCAKDAAPSLYVANGKTGALKHVLTARSRFATRWLDATTLAYEDGDGGIRLWDATTGREALRLDNKPGVALDVLSLASGPLCKQAPPTTEPAGSGEDPVPPDDLGPGTSPP